MAKLHFFDWLAMILLAVGAVAWGIFGVSGFNIVNLIFQLNWLVTIIYVAIGIAGVYSFYTIFKLALMHR